VYIVMAIGADDVFIWFGACTCGRKSHSYIIISPVCFVWIIDNDIYRGWYLNDITARG
jgi:hypothetical protein